MPARIVLSPGRVSRVERSPPASDVPESDEAAGLAFAVPASDAPVVEADDAPDAPAPPPTGVRSQTTSASISATIFSCSIHSTMKGSSQSSHHASAGSAVTGTALVLGLDSPRNFQFQLPSGRVVLDLPTSRPSSLSMSSPAGSGNSLLSLGPLSMFPKPKPGGGGMLTPLADVLLLLENKSLLFLLLENRSPDSIIMLLEPRPRTALAPAPGAGSLSVVKPRIAPRRGPLPLLDDAGVFEFPIPSGVLVLPPTPQPQPYAASRIHSR